MDEWREGDGPPLDEDGMRLLFKEEIAEMAGVTLSTITWTISAARRARAHHKPAYFPARKKRIRRIKIKGDGRPLVTLTPVFREDEILNWLIHRRGPGGKLLSELRTGQPPPVLSTAELRAQATAAETARRMDTG